MTVDVIHGFSEKKSYYSFWQIGVGWATRGIGFSEKIDFRRVVRLARASGFAAADLISHFVPPSLPYLYVLLSRLYSKERQIGPARPAVVFTVGMRLTYDLSRGNRVGGAGCVFLIFTDCAARWNCIPSSDSLHCYSIQETHYIHICTNVCTQVERNSNVCRVEMLLSCLQIFLPLLSSTRPLL